MKKNRKFGVHCLLTTLILSAAMMCGCSSGTGTGAGVALVDSSGNHSTSFITSHPALAVSSVDQCKSCHGDDLTGGIAKTSCFTATCHHGTIPGWALPATHGATAKKAPGNSGFAACQICHGSDFSGGGAGIACSSCHGVNAPHPVKPWRSSPGPTHTTTDPGNAPVCAGCHFPGSPNNPANHPSVPAPAGSLPGCFNNTLCHGADTAPHALGASWTDPTSAAFHGLEAKKNLASCQSCHGTPGTIRFDGGGTSTKCSTCHASAKAHPTTWYPAPVATFPGYVPSHRDALNQATTCTICHDYTLGRTAPDNTAPSCFSASRANAEHASVACHSNGPGAASHSVPFRDTAHTSVAQSGFDSTCAACHAVTGSSPLSTAPVCTVCHAAGSPLSLGSCTSCHARPPSGTAFPNVAGRHVEHNALTGVTGVCGTCHNGLDSGSQAHYDHANARPGKDALRVPPGDTSFLSAYNAKSGAASFNATALTCSNVSCHGGLSTPNWQTGALDVNIQCTSCHALGTALGTPENNSPYSGMHAFHLGVTVNALCTECHAMSNGTTGAANHFKFLNTPQMEGPASQTVAPLGVASNYTAQGQTCGTFTCHNQLHSGFSWSGAAGASHSVPFLGTAHTSVAQSGFDSTCAACHAVTGSSPLSTAPVCTVCHAAGSPLSLGSCTSCHARPPSGTAFPNVAGRHVEHNALTGVTGVCGPCHNGLDSGSQAHYDHANARPGKDALRVPPGDTSFLSAYNAKSGAASFNATALTCSNVSRPAKTALTPISCT